MWYHNTNISAKAKDDLLNRVAERLIQTQVFLDNSLSIYCGALALDLEYKGNSPAPPLDESWQCDYLICWGSNVLLSANLTPEEENHDTPPSALPGLPMLNFSRTCSLTEIMDNISSSVERVLTKILDENLPTEWTFSGFPVSPLLLPALTSACLLERKDSAYRCPHPFWQPTQYGLDCGLNFGYAAVDYMVQRFPYYSSRVSPVIVDLLKQRAEADAGIQWKETIPFDQRIARLKQGLPSDSAYSAYVVRQMADMPLDRYLREFPEDLDEMRKTLPMLKDDATYQDAAVLVYQLSLSRDKWPKELSDMSIEYRVLMEILAKPLRKELNDLQQQKG